MAKAAVAEVTAVEAFETGDFDAILDRQSDDIQPPANAPSGPWVLRCIGTFFKKTSAEDLESDPTLPIGQVLFYHTPYEPRDGVNQEAVEEGTWRGKRIVTKRNIKVPGDDYAALKIARMHGVDTTGRSLREVLALCKDRMVQGTIGVYSYTKNKGTPNEETITENNIGNFALLS